MKDNKIQNEVVIIDFKLGNLFSVEHACIHVGLNPIITSDKETIANAKAIVLPGVGAFGNAMQNLQKFDLINPIKEQAQEGTPILGICLGLQLLFTESEEFGNNKGLGLIDGLIKKFPSQLENRKIKVPQVGWNSIYNNENSKWQNTPLQTMEHNEFMYFVHSYYAIPENKNEILTYTNYENIEYCSSIKKENIFATQFHPEKSATKGIEIYKNWADLILNI